MKLAPLLLILGACAVPDDLAIARVDHVQPRAIAHLTRYTGGHSRAGVVLAPDGRLWGTGWQGGPTAGGDEERSCSSNYYWPTDEQRLRCPGTVWSIAVDGTDLRVEHTFSHLDAAKRNPDGYQPAAALTVGADGKIYGTTTKGGAPPSPTIAGCGVAFRIDPAVPGSFDVVHTFCSSARFADGANPYGSLVHDGAGGAYLATANGSAPCGPSGCPGGAGMVVRIDLATGASTQVYAFPPLIGPAGTLRTNATGSSPYSTPAIGPDGKLVGMTVWGGPHGRGSVYRLDPATRAIEVIHAWPDYTWLGNADNAPQQSLTLSSAGEFWGTNVGGGAAGAGLVFKVDRDGNYVQLHEFSTVGPTTTPRFSNLDGAQPVSGLVEDRDHRMWGASLYGGSLGLGTLFWFDCGASPQLEVASSFLDAPNLNRAYGTMVRLGDGLIGTTFADGESGYGGVFSVDLD